MKMYKQRKQYRKGTSRTNKGIDQRKKGKVKIRASKRQS